MAKAYDKKEDCFVEQFNNYPIDKKTNKRIEVYCLLYVLNYFTEDIFNLLFIDVHVCVRERERVNHLFLLKIYRSFLLIEITGLW